MSDLPPHVYQFGPFRLDLTEREVLRKGKPVALTPKAFDVLAFLVQRRGHLVEKEELMSNVWADCFVEEANVTRTIWMLRQALEDDHNGFIQTIPKHGYRFIAEQATGSNGQSDATGNSFGPNIGTQNDTGTVSKEAYELYLRGRYHLRCETEESVREAIALQEEATRLTPNFAIAYTELARAYHLNAYYFTPEENHWEEKAWVACEWAMSIDPHLAEAHFVRGLLLWTYANGFPHEQVIEEYRRALELNPNLDEVHHQIGLVLHHIGLLDQAMSNYEKALAINPANNIVRIRYAAVRNLKHQYDEAISVLEAMPAEITPAVNIVKGMALAHLGRLDEAKEYTNKWLACHKKDDGGLIASIQAMIAALRGEKREAVEKINRSIEIGQGYGHFHHSTYNIAVSYAIMRKPDEAIKWLKYTVNNGFPCYPMFEGDPFLENLKQDARYIEFMQRQNREWELRMNSL